MMFTNFEYYKNKYYGTLVPELRFPYYAKRASAIINSETFGRVKKIVDETTNPKEAEPILPIPDEIQDCACFIVEALYQKDEAPQIVSHCAGGESITYAIDNSSTIDDAVREGLTLFLPAELLYRGI